jgi:hypothetical protein
LYQFIITKINNCVYLPYGWQGNRK